MTAIDTNILVYAFDTAYAQKRKVCRTILQEVFEGKKQGVVTNQILAEFAYVVTRKIEKPLSKNEVRAIIASILNSSNWKVYNYKGDNVFHAILSEQSFWDALIVQTLKENNVPEIITENVKDFVGTGINAKNPLS